MELKISELIKKYRHKGRSQEKHLVERHLNAYHLARAVLQAPDSRPKELVRQLEKDMGVNRVPFRVVAELDRYDLHPRKRVTWAEQIIEVGECLSEFATGDPGDCDHKALYEQAKRYLAANRSEEYLRLGTQAAHPIESKAILYAFYTELPDSVSYKAILHDTAKLANAKHAKTLLDELVELIAVERGLRPKKPARERALRGSAETRELPESLTRRDTPSPMPEDDIPFDRIADENVMAEEEALHENADLRAALEIALQQFEVATEKLEQVQAEAKHEAILAFFQEMNSSKHSNLLDKFLEAEDLVKRLKKDGVEIPQEIELIPIIVRLFNRFLKTQGIRPKAVVGETKEITLSESDEYEYIGSEWENAEEPKTVKVISAGWLYDGTLKGDTSASIVINKPKVQEVTTPP